MSVIHIPRRNYTQPQGRVAIAPEWANTRLAVNWANPCFDVMSGSFLDRVSVNGGSTERVTEYGIGLGTNGATSFNRTGAVLANGDITLMWLGYADASSTDSVSMFHQEGASGASQFGYNFNDQTAFGSGYAGRLAVMLLQTGVNRSYAWVPGVADGKLHCVLFRKRGTTVGFWIDGVYVAPTVSGGFTGTPFHAADTVRVLGRSDDGAAAAKGGALVTAAWNLALTDGAAESLTANPWQLFRAEPRRIYSFPSGGIVIPTLSALTTTHITSSGARHTLTLSGF